MTYRQCIVQHLDTGEVAARVPLGTHESVYQALERARVPIRSRCRGSTICGLCWVVPLEGAEGLAPPLPDELHLLSLTAKGVQGARLSCRLKMPPGQDRLVVAARLADKP